MFALVTIAILRFPAFLAKSIAAFAILLVPDSVVILKSTASEASSPSIRQPLLPRTYSPSVFSLKKVQSIFFPSTLIGLTFANRSSSLLRATLALSRPSPLGVVVGPFRNTSQVLISSRTSFGKASPFSIRFSIVRPSIFFSFTSPRSSSPAKITLRSLSASLVMTGPIPSP